MGNGKEQAVPLDREIVKPKRGRVVMQPKISVIMPVFDAGLTLKECIDSILAQSLRDFELICVDDGSEDESGEILRQYARNDKRICLVQSVRRGAGHARNLGLARARGEYLLFLDADDVFYPHMFACLYQAASTERLDIAICRFEMTHTETGKRHLADWALRRELLPVQRPFQAGDVEHDFFGAIMWFPWNKLFSSSFIREQGIVFQELDSTNDLLFVEKAMLLARRIDYVDDVLMAYRMGNKMSLQGRKGKDWRSFVAAFEALEKFLQLHDRAGRFEQDFANVLLRASISYTENCRGDEKNGLLQELAGGLWQRMKLLKRPSDYFYDKYLYRRLHKLAIESFVDDSGKGSGKMEKKMTKKSEKTKGNSALKTVAKDKNNKKDVLEAAYNGGMIVYGIGAHLTDMLGWHRELANRIARVIDKDEAKIGQEVPGLYKKVEGPEALKNLPAGTQVVISALRYYEEIAQELHGLNPGLVCHNIDDAVTLIHQAEAKGMLVYGAGAHLEDMLGWHPDLSGRIGRIFDKNEKRSGQMVSGTDRCIEPVEKLKWLPAGTKIAISAIRYYDEIAEELYALNPGLVCQDIDEAYSLLPPVKTATKSVAAVSSFAKPVQGGLTNLQRQRLRGKEAQARWRQRFLLNCANCRRIFWGTRGVRASYLRKEFQPLMGRGDIFIEEDLSLRGQMVNGLPICIPDALKDVKGKFVIIVLDRDYAKVRERLLDYGYVENVDFVEGRQLLGEDENGYIDVPCLDKAQAGMIVYGLGAHLEDMLKWHPELAGKISRVIDKDPKKVGTVVSGLGVYVEPPEVLCNLPSGTEVAVSAIKYLSDIEKDIHALQPGVICRDIDKIWKEYV